MSKSEIVHFTVTGEFITQQARSFWNDENDPPRAMRLLECMHGITRAQILDVLEGRAKLTGDSSVGVGIEPDNAICKTLDEILKAQQQKQAELEDEKADTIQMAIGDTIMVGSPTGARMVPRRKAIRYGTSRAGCLGDGWEFDDVLEDPEAQKIRENAERFGKKAHQDPKPLRIWRQLHDTPSYAREVAAQSAEPRREYEIAESVEDELEGAKHVLIEKQNRENAKRYLDPQPKVTKNTGWLSPEGVFYPCGHSQHALIMYALGMTSSPQNHMVKPEGWLRLGMNDDRQYVFDDELHTPPTAIQRQLILAWCEESGCERPFGFREDD